MTKSSEDHMSTPSIPSSFKDTVWDEISKARNIEVTELRRDTNGGATFRVSLDVILDRNALTECGQIASKRGSRVVKVIRQTAKYGFKLFFSDDEGPDQSDTARPLADTDDHSITKHNPNF